VEAARAFPESDRVERLAATWLGREEALLRRTALVMLAHLPADVAARLLETGLDEDPDPVVRRRSERLAARSGSG
jgi:hypothetical protein